MDLLLRTLSPYLAFGYMSFVGRTTRLRWLGLEHVEGLRRRGENFIYALWHDRQALFSFTHRGAPVAAMVSRSKDGDLMAEVMRLSRIRAVRGSSSRGAFQATRELLEIAALGVRPALTPDGPRGPARKAKPGAVYLARKAGLAIIPITNATSRKLLLKNAWDQYQIPLPFARACVLHGAPIRVSPQDDPRAKTRELEESLNRITQEAERLVAG